MTRLAFIDTETTSLRPDRRAWEIAVILREPGERDTEHSWFIDADDLDLGNADPFSLKVGRFHERHPQYQLDREPRFDETHDEADVLRLVEAITRRAHIVGAVPNFDTEVLGTRMRAHGICPSWHYHLCDVEALAVGHLSALADACARREPGEIPGPERAAEIRKLASPPWKSDDLSAALGITVSEEDRHTALGDARWARAIYDAVMGGAS